MEVWDLKQADKLGDKPMVTFRETKNGEVRSVKLVAEAVELSKNYLEGWIPCRFSQVKKLLTKIMISGTHSRKHWRWHKFQILAGTI